MMIHQCPHCFIQFQEITELLEHFTAHNGFRRFKCKFCPKWFLYENQLAYHERIGHKDLNKGIICPNCGEKWKTTNSFIGHYRTEHMTDGKAFVCNSCNQMYGTSYRFLSHLRNVHKNELYLCDQCTKSFTISYGLERHTRHYHPNVHKHSYAECGQCFSNLKNFKSYCATAHKLNRTSETLAKNYFLKRKV